ncbi:unnamed protein product [Haemonchus placei]|uniref:Uncharacterized protein n=1 Tax=Haemonchus placei TaxID=6290 RepID=A0A0N4X9D6_HAEPC|nr:unnamed protein product [Haemonchus placei]
MNITQHVKLTREEPRDSWFPYVSTQIKVSSGVVSVKFYPKASKEYLTSRYISSSIWLRAATNVCTGEAERHKPQRLACGIAAVTDYTDVDRNPSDFGLSRAALLPKRQRSSNDVRLLLSPEGTRQQKSSLRDQRLTSHGTHWRAFARVAHKRDDRDCEVCLNVDDRRSVGSTPVETSEQHHMNGGRPVHNSPVVQDPGVFLIGLLLCSPFSVFN